MIDDNAPGTPEMIQFTKNLEQALTSLQRKTRDKALEGITLKLGKRKKRLIDPKIKDKLRPYTANPPSREELNDIAWESSADEIEKALIEKLDIHDKPTDEYKAYNEDDKNK